MARRAGAGHHPRGCRVNVDDIIRAPHTCCICLDEIPDYPIGANNPDPVTTEGQCCDICNWNHVIPQRIADMEREA